MTFRKPEAQAERMPRWHDTAARIPFGSRLGLPTNHNARSGSDGNAAAILDTPREFPSAHASGFPTAELNDARQNAPA
jgi:hypothetical protein